MTQPGVSAIILAAGKSRRMAGGNKLLAEAGGGPMIRRVAGTALASEAAEVIVVTGHEAARVEAALDGLDVRLVGNPDYADGLSTSLKTGIRAVGSASAGALILLGDMPKLRAATLDALIAAFGGGGGRDIYRPVFDGRAGNPVLWPRGFFPEILELSGDAGARTLLDRHAGLVRAVPVDDAGILFDVDTADDLGKL